jgi:hypothetical protein
VSIPSFDPLAGSLTCAVAVVAYPASSSPVAGRFLRGPSRSRAFIFNGGSVTSLQTQYELLREAGCGHGEALGKLALKLGVDKATVERVLKRASYTPRRERAASRAA